MMAVATIRGVFEDMRRAQRAITDACDRQPEGWRHEVVRHRRVLAEQIGLMAPLLVADPGGGPVGSALSALRTALAAHQASWPAVSIDTASPDYRASARRVRAAYDALDRAIRPGGGSAPASGD